MVSFPLNSVRWKIAALVLLVGLTGVVNETYSQVVLSIQPRNTGQTQFNGGQTYTWDIIANSTSTSSTPTSDYNIAAQKIADINWDIRIDVYAPANGGNVTVSNFVAASGSTDFFNGYATAPLQYTTSFISTGVLQNNDRHLVSFTDGPSNKANYIVASFDAMFSNTLIGQGFVWDFPSATVLNVDGTELPVSATSFTGSVIPEPSTCALAFGAASLAVSAWRRKTRKV